MKFQRFSILFLSLILVSCGSSEELTNTSSPISSTSIQQIECSRASIESAVGESTSVFNCAGEWAAIQPSSYVSDCTECESVWLYKWSQEKWNLMGRCNQYVPLVESQTPCSAMAGWLNDGNYIDKMADFPPSDVACTIWPTNRFSENVAITGCTPDPIE